MFYMQSHNLNIKLKIIKIGDVMKRLACIMLALELILMPLSVAVGKQPSLRKIKQDIEADANKYGSEFCAALLVWVVVITLLALVTLNMSVHLKSVIDDINSNLEKL
jgi:hypothetical protein